MNNFKTDINGGLPLVLDDLRWIDSSYRTAFKGIMSAFGVTDQYTFILSGCVRSVSTGVVTIAEGYVSIGGEICYVPEQSYSEPTGGDVEYWVVDTSFDSSGEKTFQNSVINDTYEVRNAQISVGASVPSGNTSYADTKTIHQLIHENLPRDTWHNIYTDTVATGPTAGTYNVDVTLDLSGFTHFRGVYYAGEDVTQGAVNVLIATLPVGYRPSVQKRYSVIAESAGSAPNNVITIDTNGEIRWRFSSTDFYAFLDLSQLIPFEAE